MAHQLRLSAGQADQPRAPIRADCRTCRQAP